MERFELQEKAIAGLREFATEHNCHITLVRNNAHMLAYAACLCNVNCRWDACCASIRLFIHGKRMTTHHCRWHPYLELPKSPR